MIHIGPDGRPREASFWRLLLPCLQALMGVAMWTRTAYWSKLTVVGVISAVIDLIAWILVVLGVTGIVSEAKR